MGLVSSAQAGPRHMEPLAGKTIDPYLDLLSHLGELGMAQPVGHDEVQRIRDLARAATQLLVSIASAPPPAGVGRGQGRGATLQHQAVALRGLAGFLLRCAEGELGVPLVREALAAGLGSVLGAWGRSTPLDAIASFVLGSADLIRQTQEVIDQLLQVGRTPPGPQHVLS